MLPVAFLQRPLCWLQTISRTRDTISGGLSFAYDLCVRKITLERRAVVFTMRSSVLEHSVVQVFGTDRGNEEYLVEVEGRYRQKWEQSPDVEALAQAIRQAVA